MFSHREAWTGWKFAPLLHATQTGWNGQPPPSAEEHWGEDSLPTAEGSRQQDTNRDCKKEQHEEDHWNGWRDSGGFKQCFCDFLFTMNFVSFSVCSLSMKKAQQVIQLQLTLILKLVVRLSASLMIVHAGTHKHSRPSTPDQKVGWTFCLKQIHHGIQSPSAMLLQQLSHGPIPVFLWHVSFLALSCDPS